VKSPEFIYSEFARTQQIIESEVGIVPNLLRAPYGLRWFGMRSMQARLHLLGVMWTVIGHDWEWPANRVSARVLGRASPGGIICLHDGRDVQPTPDTSEMLAAVRTIVPVLKDQGYSFETVGQLLRPDPGTAAAA
jgi:peptidoglycan/xylan/chitin deacetylase (PgdA/CDA1 family)